MTIRVMHLTSDLDLGGAEMAMVNFVTRLDTDRFTPSVCTLSRQGVLRERLLAAGVEVFHLPFRRRMSPVGIWRLSQLLRREKIAIVHTHLRRSGFAGRLAAVLAKTPAIIHHEHSLEHEPRTSQRCLYRFLTRRTSAVLCVSEQVKHERLAWTKADPKNFHVLPNGIDFARFHHHDPAESPAAIRHELGILTREQSASAAEPFVIGTVGRLSSIKNHALFLAACAKVFAARPGEDGYVLIVGEGKLRGALEAQADALGIRERVIFTGGRTDVERLLRSMTVFVLTSQSEGFGLAPLEAQAAGVPVITTPAGAAQELIEHEKTGLLVLDETPNKIAAAIERVLSEPHLAHTLKANAPAAAQAYDLATVIDRLQTIYEQAHP